MMTGASTSIWTGDPTLIRVRASIVIAPNRCRIGAWVILDGSWAVPIAREGRFGAFGAVVSSEHPASAVVTKAKPAMYLVRTVDLLMWETESVARS